VKYNPFCETEIIFATPAQMEARLYSIKRKNIVLVMSETSAERLGFLPFVDRYYKKAEDAGGSLIWIKDINPNPSIRDLQMLLGEIEKLDVDLFISIGGGSAIDMAKALSAFKGYGYEEGLTSSQIKSVISEKKYKNKRFADIVAIPTTSGTGTEVTQWATIWDDVEKVKYSIDDPGLKPKLAIIVPELTVSMPAALTLSTGLDAMCQAVESFWSIHTTPIVQGIAAQSIRIIIDNLRAAVDNPEDLAIRENLSKASVLAGLAFSQTRTTACHSISYPLTLFFGIPHGIAAVITLDAVSKINKGHFPNDRQLFDLFEKYGDIQSFIEYACNSVWDMRLTAFGIEKQDIPRIVDYAFTEGRMDNNPVDLSREDVALILESIL